MVRYGRGGGGRCELQGGYRSTAGLGRAWGGDKRGGGGQKGGGRGLLVEGGYLQEGGDNRTGVPRL